PGLLIFKSGFGAHEPAEARASRKTQLSLFLRRLDVAANLAAGGEVRVHVGVADAGANRGDDVVEMAGQELLGRLAAGDDVRGRDGSGYDGFGRLPGGALGRVAGRVEKRARCLAEPDDDAAVHAGLADMDVRLLHGALQPAVSQLVGD